MREQYKDFVTDLQGNWIDNILTFSLKTYGFKIDGTLTVDDKAVRLAGIFRLPRSCFGARSNNRLPASCGGNCPRAAEGQVGLYVL